ncbi:MAG: CvpA family protein, partial [Anaerovorax sp.]
MIVDGVILVLVIFTGIQGYRHGFVQTFVQMTGWILSIVLAFTWLPQVSEFLLQNTTFYDTIHALISANIALDSVAFENSLNNFPSLISDLIISAATTISDTIATKISRAVFSLSCFFLIIIALKLFFFLLVKLFSKKSNHGIIGGIDSFLGLIIGTLKGLVVVFIVLAL